MNRKIPYLSTEYTKVNINNEKSNKFGKLTRKVLVSLFISNEKIGHRIIRPRNKKRFQNNLMRSTNLYFKKVIMYIKRNKLIRKNWRYKI